MAGARAVFINSASLVLASVCFLNCGGGSNADSAQRDSGNPMDAGVDGSTDAEQGTDAFDQDAQESGIESDASTTDASTTDAGTIDAGPVEQLDQITQEGITWHFDKAYPCGQFANKNDWWCVGPLTITQITPDFTGTYNGWEVNPSSTNSQSFDERSPMGEFQPPPSLPYTAHPGESIVKVDSWEERDADCKSADHTVGQSGSYSHPICVWAASVLTVLSDVPQNNGATVFRPPYFGTEKPLYSTTSLRTDLLPSLPADPLSDPPTLQWVYDKYKNVFLDHGYRWYGYSLLPNKWTSEYGSVIGKDAGDAVLRLFLDDPLADKMDALIAFVQRGIDIYHMYAAGHSWPGAGGWGNGRKLPMVFTAAMLGDAEMMAAVKEAAQRITYAPDGTAPAHPFHEDNSVYRSTVTGMALFGQNWDSGTEEKYWLNQTTGGSSKDIRDPYGYIDGGMVPGGSYQFCCNSATWRAPALACRLMDDVRELWNYEPFLEYTDRWVTQGAWTLPDPCSATDPGPNYDGTCVNGTPRFAAQHGVNANGGSYSTKFVTEMWENYR